jgi:ribosome-associated protein
VNREPSTLVTVHGSPFTVHRSPGISIALVRAVSSVTAIPEFMAAPAPIPNYTSLELAQRAATILLDRKGNDVVLLGLKEVSDMTDYFLIASGTSDTHVRALGNAVLEDMKKDVAQTAHHVEGLQTGRWVLLDYVDFVVHVFHPTLRNFYQIERLWADAAVIPITADASR